MEFIFLLFLFALYILLLMPDGFVTSKDCDIFFMGFTIYCLLIINII